MRATFDHKDRDLETFLLEFNDEDVFSRLGVQITQKLFCSPFREDKKPTCTLSRSSNGILYYRDWAYQERSVGFLDLVMEIHRFSFSEALNYLWELMEGAKSIKAYSSNQKVYVIKKSNIYNLKAIERKWTYSDLKWWHQWGIEPLTLDYFKIRPAYKVIENDIVSYIHGPQINPAYIYYLKGSIKIYLPLNKSRRFIHQDGQAIQGYDQLPDFGNGIVITKSLKDVCLFYQFGIHAVAPQSENTSVSDDMLSELYYRFGKIVVMMDNDRAGKQALLRYRKRQIKDICFIPNKFRSKDLTDFYKLWGYNETFQLINRAKRYYLKG